MHKIRSNSLTSRTVVAFLIVSALSGCAVNPVPITHEDRALSLKTDLETMYRDQAPISGALSFEDAVDRTLKYNLENRLKLMEQALAAGQMDLARYDMLPRLVAAAGYTVRNNNLVVDSMDVSTGNIALGNTTSQERGRFTADLTFSWNVLDFGVSYFQAHQQADRALILQERVRKTVHQLVQQVRSAYWLSVGAQALEGRVDPLVNQAMSALADVDRVERERLRPPLETLNYRRTVLDTLRQLEAIRDELKQAKPRLAALMNLAPGTAFSVVVPGDLKLPTVDYSLEQMEERALMQRPELFEADLQERISVAETKKALARTLPGIEVYAGPHYDSNQYLQSNQWADAGLRVSWNLLNLLSGPKQRKVAESQLEVTKAQRLAMNMAVLTQVNVASREFEGRKRQYRLADALFDVENKIHEHIKTAADSDAQSKLNETRSAAASLVAEYRRYQNYAMIQSAYGQLLATLGEDLAPDNLASLTLSSDQSAKVLQ